VKDLRYNGNKCKSFRNAEISVIYYHAYRVDFRLYIAANIVCVSTKSLKLYYCYVLY
jgi:hypothetical protein